MKNDNLRLMYFVVVAIATTGCAGTQTSTVRRYNDLRDKGDIERAKAMIAPGARIWFENPTGDGMPWTPGSGTWGG